MRIEQASRAFAERGCSSGAAAIAGLPRAHLLQLLIDEGIAILDGRSTIAGEVAALAEDLDNDRLRTAAQESATDRPAAAG